MKSASKRGSCGTSASRRAISRRASEATGSSAQLDRPRCGASRPARSRTSVDLPEPFGPEQADHLAGLDREGQVLDARRRSRSGSRGRRPRCGRAE